MSLLCGNCEDFGIHFSEPHMLTLLIFWGCGEVHASIQAWGGWFVGRVGSEVDFWQGMFAGVFRGPREL